MVHFRAARFLLGGEVRSALLDERHHAFLLILCAECLKNKKIRKTRLREVTRELTAWKKRRSKRRPSCNVDSYATFTDSLHNATASCECDEIFSPSFTASPTSLSLAKTLLTNPAFSASSAVIMLPVNTISIVFDLPITRVSR